MKYFSKALLHLYIVPAVILLTMSVSAAALKIGPYDQVRLTFVADDGTKHTQEISGFSHEIVSPRDPASGLPAGKRQHKPFAVTKSVDKATPLLFNLLIINGSIKQWHLELLRGQDGDMRLVRTVDLLTPSVCGISSTDSNKNLLEREHVSFCYQKITWTWQDGGSVKDDWETPSIQLPAGAGCHYINVPRTLS